MQDEPQGISAEQVNLLAWKVADGTATPDEAQQLLQEAVRQADSLRLSRRMIEHLRDCMAAFLKGRRMLLPNREMGRDEPKDVEITTLDKAFGITRASRGQPPVAYDEHCIAASQVLSKLLQGKSLEEATEAVAETRKAEGRPLTSDTQVSDAWAAHKAGGLMLLRLSRSAEGRGWTARELQQLGELYADIEGVILAAEKAFEGRHTPPENSANTPP